MKSMIASVTKTLILFCLFPVLICSVNAAPRIVVGLVDSPPIFEIGPNGEPSGTGVASIKLILDRTGLDYLIKIYPAARLRKVFGDGDVHITITRDPSNMPFLVRLRILFSKYPVGNSFYNLYSINGRPTNSLEDIQGKKLLQVLGFALPNDIQEFIDDPDNQITTDQSPSVLSVVRKLLAGRGDYLIMSAKQFEQLLGKNEGLKQKLASAQLASVSIKKNTTHLGVNKKVADAEDLMERIDQAMEQLKAEGKL